MEKDKNIREHPVHNKKKPSEKISGDDSTNISGRYKSDKINSQNKGEKLPGKENPDRRKEIDDNPEETKRKIPRMKD